MCESQRVWQVLYLEDQPINVMLMQEVFEQCLQLQLVEATTRSEARAVAEWIRPDPLAAGPAAAR